MGRRFCKNRVPYLTTQHFKALCSFARCLFFGKKYNVVLNVALVEIFRIELSAIFKNKIKKIKNKKNNLFIFCL